VSIWQPPYTFLSKVPHYYCHCSYLFIETHRKSQNGWEFMLQPIPRIPYISLYAKIYCLETTQSATNDNLISLFSPIRIQAKTRLNVYITKETLIPRTTRSGFALWEQCNLSAGCSPCSLALLVPIEIIFQRHFLGLIIGRSPREGWKPLCRISRLPKKWDTSVSGCRTIQCSLRL
jgi:hypothetical protein